MTRAFKADFHMHTHHSVDSLSRVEDVLAAATKQGMGAIAITDHDDIVGAIEAQKIARAQKLPLQVIVGEEVTCPVMGSGALATALPMVRIQAPDGAYDYQNKYFTDAVSYLCPSGLPAAEEAEIARIVLAAFRALGCRGWGRADLMVRASDRKPFLLEMNTSPGMTSHSLVPMSARAQGISYEDLCVRLLALASLDTSPTHRRAP